MNAAQSAGLYIHIPFCKARCGYCDFVTFTGHEHMMGRYVDALLQELRLLRDAYAPEVHVETIFFGGGTPSLLDAGDIGRILNVVRENFGGRWSEVTLEANPESATGEKARAWRDAGVDRISLGLQSLDDALLQRMGRLHSAEGFLRAFDDVRRAGFSNVNIDLIYGFENQSRESWSATLDGVIALDPEHLSLYALAVEPHTPFAVEGHRTNSDIQAAMYDEARQRLSASRYEQYEISNFSKPGLACRHNLIYWRQKPYLGAGVGAVGCVGGTRWQVAKDFGVYFKSLQERRLPWISTEPIDGKTQKFEWLMLGLRLREGLDWSAEDDARWLKERERLRREGLLEEVRPGTWRIAERAVGLTNQVLLPFL